MPNVTSPSLETAAEEMATLTIRKGKEAALEIGGLRIAACRREIGEIDGGVSVYVFRAADPSDELFRMDLFRKRPHYHAPATNQDEENIEAEEGSAVEWGVTALSERAGDLAAEGGFSDAAGEIDPVALRGASGRIRDMLATLGEPTEVSHFDVPKAMLEKLAKG